MTYVYCPVKGIGAYELCQSLGATRLKRFDGDSFWCRGRRESLEPGSVVVCWGDTLPELDNLRVLNGVEKSLKTRYEQLMFLIKEKVPCLSTTLPDRSHTIKEYVNAGYLPKTHTLVSPSYPMKTTNTHPDYYVKGEVFVNEYVIHTFAGRSIRSGVKTIRPGFKIAVGEWKPDLNLAHPLIKTFEAGWYTEYAGVTSSTPMRNLAHKAVKALGLVFGVVTLGELKNGSFMVIEVDLRPGADPQTIASYTRAINRWIREGDCDEVGADGEGV